MPASLKGFRKIVVDGETFLWKVRKKISHEEWHNSLLPIPIMHMDGGQIFFAYVDFSRSGYGEYTLEAITPAMIRKCILNAIDKGWDFKLPSGAVTLRGGVLTTDTKYGGDVIFFYHVTRTCADCKNRDIFEFSKKEIAFNLYDPEVVLQTPCSRCGSTHCKEMSTHGPKLDQELLDIWGSDEDLYFMEQDEELMLARDSHLGLLLQAIDADTYLESKTNILIEAICILIYDYEKNTASTHFNISSYTHRIAAEAKSALRQRKERVAEAGDAVMDYIQEVVYPIIGITITPKG